MKIETILEEIINEFHEKFVRNRNGFEVLVAYHVDEYDKFLESKLHQLETEVREDERERLRQSMELWFDTHDRNQTTFQTNDLIKYLFEESIIK